jgi:hypothetical protein
MKHAARFAIAVVAVVLVAVGVSAQTTVPIGNVKIDFEFMAAGKAMPAGSYFFEASTSGTSVMLRTTAGAAAVLPVVTRLGRHDTDQNVELVFDKVKGELLLSEIWPAAGRDGYCLLGTTAEHTHHVVGGSKASPKP